MKVEGRARELISCIVFRLVGSSRAVLSHVYCYMSLPALHWYQKATQSHWQAGVRLEHMLKLSWLQRVTSRMWFWLPACLTKLQMLSLCSWWWSLCQTKFWNKVNFAKRKPFSLMYRVVTGSVQTRATLMPPLMHWFLYKHQCRLALD